MTLFWWVCEAYGALMVTLPPILSGSEGVCEHTLCCFAAWVGVLAGRFLVVRLGGYGQAA